jgi:hypothetical protein
MSNTNHLPDKGVNLSGLKTRDINVNKLYDKQIGLPIKIKNLNSLTALYINSEKEEKSYTG